MTEQQIAKNKKEEKSGVILNDQFIHRDIILKTGNLFFLEDPDEVIARLAEHFALNQTEFFTLPDAPEDRSLTVDDMPRFKQSLRDGLHVPKEGKDGTGN